MAADILNDSTDVLEKRRDWTEFMFGLALNLWQSRKQNKQYPTNPSEFIKSSAKTLLRNRLRRTGGAGDPRTDICSCQCHCSLQRAELGTQCQFVPEGDEVSSECACSGISRLTLTDADTAATDYKLLGSDTLQCSQSRHCSADHIRCIKMVKSASTRSGMSKKKSVSADQKTSSCETCGCSFNKSSVLNAQAFDGLESVTTAPGEVYDRRLGRLVCLDPESLTPTLKDGSCLGILKLSNSDPTLSSSATCHADQNCNNENASRCGVPLLDAVTEPLLRGFSTSNSSFTALSKSSVTLGRARKKRASFRASTRNLARKLGGSKMPEPVCPLPGNVKLSAINNLSNKPLQLLREQMDGVPATQASVTVVDNNNKVADCDSKFCDRNILGHKNNLNFKKGTSDYKSLTSSLRRRRKTLLSRTGSLALGRKVRPVAPGDGTILPKSGLLFDGSDVMMPGGSIAPSTAWSDEYDGLFDQLHHRSCPCRAHSTQVDSIVVQQLKDEMADVTAEMETLEGGEDGKNNPKSKQMSIGRKKFNMDPKKGIEYLIEHGLLKNTPDDISKFLYNGEGLNKTAIGDYLGERHEFNQTVLDAFVALHDFTDLILVQALRQFLWSFRLPGEAQKIDRMMERFARHYCELNPSIFQHPDTCFVLSFAIIMLNTSLHNPAVKDKQTLEQFINMNRGIDNGDDLPRELLESLYESIKTEPFKIPEDDGNDLMHTFFNPDREGWLWKQGGRYKSWKRRWFILNDNCLYYFEYTTDKEPRGIIPLENIEVREVHDRNKPHCFELYATSTDFIKACKTDSEGKVVEGKHTVYRMSAATHEEKEEWIKCIRQSISHNPFYDLLAKRKKNIQKNSS